MTQPHSIIFGGTKGLGKLLTQMFADSCHKLTVIARSVPEINPHPEKDVYYAAADLQDAESLSKQLKHIIDTRGEINNVVFLQRFKGEGDRWEGDLKVSLDATRTILNCLEGQFASNGAVVLASSIAGQLANDSQPLSYAVAKAGMNQMVRYYSAKLGGLGVRVNGVTPITFVKEVSKKYYFEENKKINELYKKIVPLKRMCMAEDIANAIMFLCDAKSSFISGQNIIIDGGLSALSHESLANKFEMI